MPYTGHPNTADCIGLWKMNEVAAANNAVDASTQNNVGTANGAPTVQTGKIGGARGFAGNVYFYAADIAAYRDLSEFTVSMYIYCDGTAPGAGVKSIFFSLESWLDPGAPAGRPRIVLGMDENKYLWCAYHGATSGPVWIKSTHTLTTGWHHVAYTFFRAVTPVYRLRVYVDLSLEMTAGDASDPGIIEIAPALATWMNLGADVATPLATYWRGYLDDVAFYNTEKDFAWIRDRYFDAFPAFTDPVFCGDPAIGSDFTLNSFQCLPNQYNGEFTIAGIKYPTRLYTVPYFLGTPAASLRNRKIPLSSSFG